jgi:hypothetical protein
MANDMALKERQCATGTPTAFGRQRVRDPDVSFGHERNLSVKDSDSMHLIEEID